ncbi:MAG: CADD family putative folate metabolism protein [Sandaracinaceae bacterium]
MTRTADERAFLSAIDEAIDAHAMLSHPFYRAWTAGELPLEVLREYAKQYFAQVKAFPTYVSSVHAQTEDLEARRLLLDNLVEEEGGSESHPELWLRFAEGLGIERTDVESAELLASTTRSVARLKALCRSDDPGDGLAALYAYESQIPEVARTKREGLREHYGLDDPRTVAFFSVHEEADVAHREQERELLLRGGVDIEVRERRVKAAQEAAQALWHFLDGVDAAYRQTGPTSVTRTA